MTTTQEYFSDPLKIACVNTVSDLSKIEGEIIEIVNKKFDEHNTICAKDEKWKKPDALNHRQIADVMLKIFHIHNVKVCGDIGGGKKTVLMIYVDDLVVSCCGKEYESLKGTYSSDRKIIESVISVLNACAEPRVFDSTIRTLERNATTVARCEEDYSPMNNCIFVHKTKSTIPFSPDIVITSKARINYNPNAKSVTIKNPDGSSWDWDSQLKEISCGDIEIEDALRKTVACALRPYKRWKKAIFLYGENGCNGKGTYLEAIRNIVGPDNCCSIPVADFGKDFMTEPLLTSSCVLTDENDTDAFAKNCAVFKAVVTNDPTSIRPIFGSPITFQFRGIVIECFNSLYRGADNSDSFWRRNLWISMSANLKDKENPLIKEDYLQRVEVLEYIAKQALELDFDELPEPKCSLALLDEVKMMNSPIRQFWSEISPDIENWNLLPFTFLYELYKAWYHRFVPSGTLTGKTTFVNELMNTIKDDEDWYCEDKTRQIRVTKDNMNGPEHLIAEYGLTDWMSKTYKGSDLDKKCIPVLKDKYTGLQRKITAGVDNE